MILVDMKSWIRILCLKIEVAMCLDRDPGVLYFHVMLFYHI